MSTVSGGRVRIAISSPEILAHIRHEFASKGLDVMIDGLPAVDVTVTPGTTGARPAGSALADALSGLAGPHTRHRDPATARYRLALVPHSRPRLVPDAGAGQAEHQPLSPREAEVMDSICRGMRNADIADLLQVRPKTVKNHVNRIFTKLGAGSRVEAVLIWQRTRTAVT
ncbi:helix-turn-helix transcriptional regulator [Actinoplanes sp. NPDC051861]|uniref:response regulator transcription factor n=1 Tax=Actinoplanes sp. NPDC051861 TaxID=3155170 RepID=UPI0034271D83